MEKNNLVFILVLSVFFILFDGQTFVSASKTYLFTADIKTQQATKVENPNTLIENGIDENKITQHDVNRNASERRGNVAVSIGDMKLEDNPETLTIKGSKTQAGGVLSGAPKIVQETVLPRNLTEVKRQVTLKDISSRIVGGEETQIDLHPYMVNYAGYCGGSIINHYWILTAGHCGEDGDYVQVGSTRLDGGVVYRVIRHITHPLFNKPPNSFNFDFQLLQLALPLKYGPTVQPIQLGTELDIIPGTLATVVGWGATKEGGDGATMLREVDVPIIDPEDCAAVTDGESIFFKISPTMICAAFPNGQKDACQGDSGGPLVANNRLIGIVSFGIGCARPGFPGIYSRVPVVREWILGIAGV